MTLVFQIEKHDREARIKGLMPSRGFALDVGAGNSFRWLYGGEDYGRVVAINSCVSILRELERDYTRDGWEFLLTDTRDYRPEEEFDVVTMLHVAEHLPLDDLKEVLDRLVKACRGIFILETPEQFDDNKQAAEAQGNRWNVHRSLVTADFLKRWGFTKLFWYWMNDRFSNAIFFLRR